MGLNLPYCTGMLSWESLGVCCGDRGRVGTGAGGQTCAYFKNKRVDESDSSRVEGVERRGQSFNGDKRHSRSFQPRSGLSCPTVESLDFRSS